MEKEPLTRVSISMCSRMLAHELVHLPMPVQAQELALTSPQSFRVTYSKCGHQNMEVVASVCGLSGSCFHFNVMPTLFLFKYIFILNRYIHNCKFMDMRGMIHNYYIWVSGMLITMHTQACTHVHSKSFLQVF